MTDRLSPAGSAVYNSDTLSVGDGTFDYTTNTFLLPNLQALNFATMQYNGMGNRFSTMPQYFSLIQAHGILAAITFLFLVPFAILYLRFYRGSNRWAVRVHIWCQIITLFTTTALFALGVSAVGPSRALTNPHHGIGVAIFVLVVVQFLLGWFTYSREKRKRLTHAPVKAVLHRWIGRSTALLGLAQVPLGLTLYGSPVWLFVLYALVVFGLLLAYFILSYLDERDRGREHGSEYSWVSGEGSAVANRRSGRFSTIAKTAAAGAGIAYVVNRLRNRNKGSEHSGSVIDDEKYSGADSEASNERGGWGKKLLGLGALGGLGWWLGKTLGRRHGDDAATAEYSESEVTETRPGYQSSPDTRRPLNGPPPGGFLPPPVPPTFVTGAGVGPSSAMMGAPLPPPVPAHQRHDSAASYSSDDDYSSASPSHQRRNHGIRDTIAGLGAFGLARKLFTDRKAKKEQRRIEELRQQDVEEERVNRMNSRRQKLTGDGYPRPNVQRNSVTNSDLTPLPEGGVGPSTTTGAVPFPMNPAGGYNPQPTYAAPPTVDGQPLPFAPPPPRDPGPPTGPPVGLAAGAAGAAGVAAGLAAGEVLRNRRDGSRDSRRQSRGTHSAGDTPPVSVKLNMHNDGRHVTLRRLTEEEAAADHARRRGDRNRLQRRGESASSIGPSDAGGDRWRRAEVAQRQAESQIAERQRLQASQAQLNSGNLFLGVPPPPPIPGSDHPGSVASPGTYDGTATEASTNYERNRQRRRAERAANARARAGRMEYE